MFLTVRIETSLIELFNRARKYKVGVTIAHQVTADIPAKLLSTIIGNVGTTGALQLAAEDAHFFAKELNFRDDTGKLLPEAFAMLKIGQAIVRMPTHHEGLPTHIPDNLPELAGFGPCATSDDLIALSKRNFGRAKHHKTIPLLTAQPPSTEAAASDETRIEARTNDAFEVISREKRTPRLRKPSTLPSPSSVDEEDEFKIR